MNNSTIKTGFGFGLASGVITTLGLMIGLFSSTNARGIVIAGVLTIAIADSFSDAIGMHFSEESKGAIEKDVWLSTIFTFLSKLLVTISFLPLILIFSLKLAIALNILWGFMLLSVFSYVVAKKQNNSPIRAILEHVFIMFFVIIITYYLGLWIDKIFLR